MYSSFHKLFLKHLKLCKKLRTSKYEPVVGKKQFQLSENSKLRETLVTWVAIMYIIFILASCGFYRIRNDYHFFHFIKILAIFGYVAYRIALLNASFACYPFDVHIELIKYLNKVFKFEEKLDIRSFKGKTWFISASFTLIVLLNKIMNQSQLMSMSIYFRVSFVENQNH